MQQVIKKMLLCTPLALLLAGCAGPAPVPFKGGLSILCWYNPRTYVTYATCPTNAPSATASEARDTSTSQPVNPVQNGGVSIAFDNLATLTCGGGTAASNTVPVSFSFTKQYGSIPWKGSHHEVFNPVSVSLRDVFSGALSCELFGGTSSNASSNINLTQLIQSATNALVQLNATYTQFKPQIDQIEQLISVWKAQQSATQSVSEASASTNCAAYSDKPVAPVTRRAVVCGLSCVNPSKWNGWTGDCPGTLLDQSRKRKQLEGLNYDKVLSLTNAEATIYGVTSAAIYAADGLKPDDMLFVFVSGHGGQNPDANGDESDGKDEFVCLYDGALLDDTIWKLLCKVPAGVRVVLEFDTCESRTMYRGVGTAKVVRSGKRPHDYAKAVGVRKQSRTAGDGYFKGRLLVVSGCNDGASSYGSDSGGNLTTCDIKAFASNADASYSAWFATLKRMMPKSQVPYLSEVGESFADYPAMR